MVKYLKNIIEGFPEVIKGRAATPASDKLFQVRDEKGCKAFGRGASNCIPPHHSSAFVHGQKSTTRHTHGSFNSNYNDWGKLKRLLKYLNRTKYLKLAISSKI